MTDARDELVEKMCEAAARTRGVSWAEQQEPLKGAFRDEMVAALSAIEASGMKVMGREPTLEMIGASHKAMAEAFNDEDVQPSESDVALAYRAAFDAAPVLGGKE